jgi:hypothetical protein
LETNKLKGSLSEVLVYPNPIQDFLKIGIQSLKSEGEVALLNLEGKVIF